MSKTYSILRSIFAVVFFMGAIANTIMLLTVPEIYRDFAADSWLPIYRQWWTAYVFPNTQFFVGLVIVLEIGLGCLLLSRGIGRRIGFLLGAGFMLVLVPFWWYGGALINLVFAFVFLWLQRLEQFSIPASQHGARQSH
jgi:small-conductance mechanosensitive channel